MKTVKRQSDGNVESNDDATDEEDSADGMAVIITETETRSRQTKKDSSAKRRRKSSLTQREIFAEF